jgi:hypothetical protein
MIEKYPEIFPEEIEKRYKLHGFVESSRQKLKMRRIRLKENKEAYQIHPDFVMPYMSERIEIAEKALYLKEKGLPYEEIAFVLGSNSHYENSSLKPLLLKDFKI